MHSSSPSILLVDDDTVLSAMLAEYLAAEGFLTETAASGELALQMTERNQFDLIVLDIMMPGINGIDTLKAIRARSNLPVIMVTARGDDLDRILGLELGADDYLSKPCNPRELHARIRAVLRRAVPVETGIETSAALGDLVLNPDYRSVEAAGVEISLTQTEFDLLSTLMASSNKLVTKNTLSMEVLDKPLSQWDRSIDVHISNLRKKLGPGKDNAERIRTIRGSGYLMESAANFG